MALDQFFPPVSPSPGTSHKPEVKLLEAAFGDGYSQTTRDGLNHIRHTIDLKWDVLTIGQAAVITAFLEAHGGDVPFLYRHPNAPAAITVTCKEWAQTDAAANLCAFTALFRQSFNIQA